MKVLNILCGLRSKFDGFSEVSLRDTVWSPDLYFMRLLINKIIWIPTHNMFVSCWCPSNVKMKLPTLNLIIVFGQRPEIDQFHITVLRINLIVKLIHRLCEIHIFFGRIDSLNPLNFSFQFMCSYGWYSVEKLAADLLGWKDSLLLPVQFMYLYKGLEN